MKLYRIHCAGDDVDGHRIGEFVLTSVEARNPKEAVNLIAVSDQFYLRDRGLETEHWTRHGYKVWAEEIIK